MSLGLKSYLEVAQSAGIVRILADPRLVVAAMLIGCLENCLELLTVEQPRLARQRRSLLRDRFGLLDGVQLLGLFANDAAVHLLRYGLSEPIIATKVNV